VRAGKSTIGRLLADKLALPQVSLDNLRWKYYSEIGYDPDLAQEFRRQGGFLALVLYRSLFDAYAVERTLNDHSGCVFDFGAGIFESLEDRNRVKQALKPYPNVFLLVPSPDLEISLRILADRDQTPPTDLTFDFNRHFLKHPTYYELAKFTVYTQDKTPEETCQEILDLLLI
jgi:shikimate kinase